MGKVKTLRKAKGFTLIELLIVIIIIGILATIAIISYSSQSKKAKKAAFVQGMNDAITAAGVCLASGEVLKVQANWTDATGDDVCAATGVTTAKWPSFIQSTYAGYVPLMSTNAAVIVFAGTAGMTTNVASPNNVTCSPTGCY